MTRLLGKGGSSWATAGPSGLVPSVRRGGHTLWSSPTD